MTNVLLSGQQVPALTRGCWRQYYV